MKFVLKLFLKLFFSIRIMGVEKINYEKPFIVIPNHVSFLDPFMLYPFLPKKHVFVVNTMIAKKFKFFFKFVNHITIDPFNPYSLKKVVALLKEGNSIVIFPEGRISTTGNFMKVYDGISLLAYRSKALVYPVALLGPEYSKFSKIQDKVKSKFFPKILVYFDNAINFNIDNTNNFKNKKFRTSNVVLSALQNTKFKAKIEFEKSSNLFNILLNKRSLLKKNKFIAQDSTSKITYKKLILSTYIFAKQLEKILKTEKRVGILLPNSIAHIVTLFSLFYKGISPAILNYSLGVKNIIESSKTAELKYIITSKKFVKKAKLNTAIEEIAEKHDVLYLEDIKNNINTLNKISGLFKCFINKRSQSIENNEVILFTSGSEAIPKGVVLTHRNLFLNAEQMLCVIDLTQSDKMLNALPMFHSFGLTAGTLLPILNGIKLFTYHNPLHYKIIPEVAYDNNSTVLLGTPSFLMGYAKNAHHYDFHSIRYVISGGEKLKPNVSNFWHKKFGIRILEGYGTTEASPVLSVNTPLFYKQDTVGRFLPGISYQLEPVEGIDDGGNLLIKGPNIMKGYLISQKGFVKCDEWYKSGDIVSVDIDGFVTIKSRLKRFAKICGEMINLDLVETYVEKCFGSSKYAAISKPDLNKGEKILLFTSNNNYNKKIFREYLKNNGLSILVLPAESVVLKELPLFGSGKVNYIELSKIDYSISSSLNAEDINDSAN